jgi:ATP-dependent DNA helicase RecG
VYDILLSTTVVEVGIDNPQASWVLIEEADRFGLSQLHQLRGRVGRGHVQSVCFLADSGQSSLGQERLTVIQSTTDGLKLAEEDLRLRGPGEFLGVAQSGLPLLRAMQWSDTAAIKKIFTAAQDLLDDEGSDGSKSLG